jgi:hypothetical protein
LVPTLSPGSGEKGGHPHTAYLNLLKRDGTLVPLRSVNHEIIHLSFLELSRKALPSAASPANGF